MRRRGTIGLLAVLLLAVLMPPAAGATIEEGRLAGNDRFETAVAIASAATEGASPAAYLARADAFPDALAAGTLTFGPIVLVPSDGPLPQAVLDALDRQGVQEVVALGGPAAISDATLAAAAEGRTTSDRIFGADRFTTAVAIAQRAFPDGAETVYLARADAFPDALAAGALTDGPILLVPSDGTPPQPVLDEIVRQDPTQVIALGGTAAVADATLTTAAQGRSTDRLSGNDRFATAVAIARRAFPDGAGVLYLARADAFPDALAAGALTGGPVLLVPRDGTPPEVVLTAASEIRPLSVVALGGTAAVSDATRAAVAAAAQNDDDITEPEGAILATTRPDGEPANGGGGAPSLSADGRYLAFVSAATDLGPPRRTTFDVVYVRDLTTGEVQQASLDVNGNDPRENTEEESTSPGGSFSPSISDDGRYVAFTSEAATLVEGDDNGGPDVFVRDLEAGTTTLVSANTAGNAAGGSHRSSSISADGRYVAFESNGRDLVSEPTTGINVYVRALLTSTTVLASPSGTGEGFNGNYGPSISADGRLVAFMSDDPDLLPDQPAPDALSFVAITDLAAETTTLVSSYEGADQPAVGGAGAQISPDGRYVIFVPSYQATMLEQSGDVYLRDVVDGSTMRIPGPPRLAEPFGAAVDRDARHLVVYASLPIDGRPPRSALTVVSLETGRRVRILDDRSFFGAAITPDGATIAYTRGRPDGQADVIVAPRP